MPQVRYSNDHILRQNFIENAGSYLIFFVIELY